MPHHLLLARSLELDDDTLGLREPAMGPRHSLALMAQALSSTLHVVGGSSSPPPRLTDRFWGRLLPTPALWAHTAALAGRLGPDDAIYCGGEVPGFHLATRLAGGSRGPRLSVFVHNVDRPRTRALLRVARLGSRVGRFLACAQPQVDFLHAMGVPPEQAVFLWDHTDTRFFTPGPASADKPRPCIMSVGLEQRDYRTVAQATQDLDVDVRISGFSRDAAAIGRAFPDPMPANMTRRFYEWTELRQLYRDADVVVVSLFPNRYAAGVQGLMEAMASGRPVVVTATVGLEKYIHPDVAISVPTGDAQAMREAIQHLLDHPAEAAARGARGRALALERHTMERYVQAIVDDARGLTPQAA